MVNTKKKERIYVLDTSVILHDHGSVYNFEENDIAIPITVLEELDNFKVGNDTKNFEAREFIRTLDKLAVKDNLKNWVKLPSKGRIKVIMANKRPKVDANEAFNFRKNDHNILNAAIALQEKEKSKEVVLVTKDINLRLKAKSLNLPAEDYKTGKLQDVSDLYLGKHTIEGLGSDIIREFYVKNKVEEFEFCPKPEPNNFYIFKNGSSSCLAFYSAEEQLFERVEKMHCYGIKPRNAEQAFAMHAIMNPSIKLVTLQGVAGTGKTLLALAGAIEQKNIYNQIILARPIVPLSNKDIGFLPGDASEKINPYMEPLWDNLKFIKSQFSVNEKKYKQIEEMQRDEKIIITPLAFIRGRTLSNTIFIIDEAQNLTPHEVKTIITRAGENTKIIFTGDIRQIDTPYLDEHSNGLSYLIDRLKNRPLYAHITLEKGERSELANLANELL